MREGQKRMKEQLYKRVRFERGAQKRSFDQVMAILTHMCGDEGTVSLDTDEKPAYISAINRNEILSKMRQENRFTHYRTPSTAPRTFSNPLFPVNYLDREVRKDVAAQVRETVRFNRHVCGGLFRLCCYGFHHNYLKRFRINDPVRTQCGRSAGGT